MMENVHPDELWGILEIGCEKGLTTEFGHVKSPGKVKESGPCSRLYALGK